MLNHRGRIKIYTDVESITYDNVVDVVRDAFSEHMVNVADINFLLGYDAGDQPLLREKTYRPDIDCQCVDNVAHQVTEFELDFDWSNPITLVQRGNKDSGSKKS